MASVISEAKKQRVINIVGVESKTLPSNKVIHKIRSDDGEEFATMKPQIAEVARGMQGGAAFIDYTEKVKDNGYTDYWLDKIGAAPADHDAAAPAQGAGAGVAAPAPPPPGSAVKMGSQTESLTKQEWLAKDYAIHLDSCIKTAGAALAHTVPSQPSREDLLNYASNVLAVARPWLEQIKQERGISAAKPGTVPDDSIPF